MSSMEKWQHLKIPFTDIQKATENFQENKCIGKGGYGQVYKGELTSDGMGDTKVVAVKRLNAEFGQGPKEFWTEIALLYGQDHENLMPLIGYCDEGEEKILVYEYAAHGSLDRCLRKPRSDNNNYTLLTWLQRLKICVDVARGLDHLHNVGIVHRDIKSANILLDENWVAKVSDLGLSTIIPENRSFDISNACGTPGYIEPRYMETGFVTKESDVYSFGMVLFEVLCGRLCTKEECEGQLGAIIDDSLRNQLNNVSMDKYSEIAKRCLQDDHKQRPSMNMVLKELKESLDLEENSILLGPWGGTGGVHWDDGVHSGVREITIVYGLCIDSICVTYDNNGKPFPAKKHGGNGGTKSEHIKFNFPEEILMRVSGHYYPLVYGESTLIRSLTFESNQKPYGPYGVEEGVPFSFLANGAHIVGLYGTSGMFLDSIGFCLAPNKRIHLQQNQLMSKGFTYVPPLPRGAQGAPATLERLDKRMELLFYHHQRYWPLLERLAQRESQESGIPPLPKYHPPQIDIALDGQGDQAYCIGLANARDVAAGNDDAHENVDIGTDEM